MSSIQKFEDLKVWQKAREVNLQIYKLSNKTSAAEVRAQLYVAKDLVYISSGEFTEVVNAFDRGKQKMISGLMSY